MASQSQSVKEVSTSNFIATPSSSFTPITTSHCSDFSTYIPESLRLPGHVVVYTQTLKGGTSSAISSPPLSPRMKKYNKMLTKVSNSPGSLTGSVNISHVHNGTQFEKNRANPSPQNPSGTRNISEKIIGSHKSPRNFKFPSSLVAKSNSDSHQKCVTASEDISQGTGNPLPVSAYIHDEFVYYEYSENDECDDENSTNQKSLDSSLSQGEIFANSMQEVNSLVSIQGYSIENPSHGTGAHFPIKASEKFTLSNSQQNSSTLNCTRHTPIADDIQVLQSDILKSHPATTALRVAKEKVVDSTHHHQGTKKIRFKFKKLTPAESIEEYLSKAESLSYEELYHRTANVALLMTKLQEEARMIDKEINDFEVAKKSDQQIALEEAKLEKEQAQREDDEIFSILLRKYGSFARSRIDEWTEFHENFNENHPEENPKNYRLVLLLRNPQYVNDFHKRTLAREKARLKAKTVKLANTIDSPLSKMEQKALEESDRKKRKPAIDPLVFEDRKMADVYGLSYKVGGAYVGNQPLRDRSGLLKGEILTNNLDENSRPRRSRGKKGNYDTDQSDNTPVVSDAEEMTRTKRTRSSRAFRDPTTSPRAASRTTPSSRESTPGAGSKIFASGKRVGRPAGSKSQVKLPSKLKSVQAAGEVASVSEENESDILAESEKKKFHSPPAIVIEQYDQVLERNVDENKSNEGRIHSEAHFNEEIVQKVPEHFPKTKDKTKRSRKSPTQKIMKKSEECLKTNSKRRTTSVKKRTTATKLDSDVLPSTEVDENANSFLSVSFSRPSSSSSTDTRSAPNQLQKRSVSKVSGPVVSQENDFKTRRVISRQGGESENTTEDIQSYQLTKKRQRDITTYSPNSDKATDLSDNKDISQSPKKTLQDTSKNTAQVAPFSDTINENSRDPGTHNSFTQYTIPIKAQLPLSSEDNEDTLITNNECLAPKPCTSKKVNVNSRNEDYSSPYRKKRKLSGIVNQKLNVPGSSEKLESFQDMYQMISHANYSNSPTASNMACTSSFANPGGEISTVLARHALPTHSQNGSRITVHSDNHDMFVSCDKAPHNNTYKIDEISRQNQEPSAQIIVQNSKTTSHHENNDFLHAEQNYSQSSSNTNRSSPSIQVRNQPNSTIYNAQTETSQGALETSPSFKLPPISTEENLTFSGAVQPSLTSSLNSVGPRRGSRSKFPSKRLQGFDGTNEDEPMQVRDDRLSEYEKFQALTSQAGSVSLGKRQRKLRVDLSFQDRIFEEGI